VLCLGGLSESLINVGFASSAGEDATANVRGDLDRAERKSDGAENVTGSPAVTFAPSCDIARTSSTVLIAPILPLQLAHDSSGGE
jgi:hypothetical protein